MKRTAPLSLELVKEHEATGVDPEIFEREGPEAIIYKILERSGP